MGCSESWRAPDGIAEVSLRSVVVSLLSGEYASQIVEARIVGEVLGGPIEKTVRLRKITLFNLALDLEDLALSIR